MGCCQYERTDSRPGCVHLECVRQSVLQSQQSAERCGHPEVVHTRFADQQIHCGHCLSAHHQFRGSEMLGSWVGQEWLRCHRSVPGHWEASGCAPDSQCQLPGGAAGNPTGLLLRPQSHQLHLCRRRSWQGCLHRGWGISACLHQQWCMVRGGFGGLGHWMRPGRSSGCLCQCGHLSALDPNNADVIETNFKQ